MARIPTRVSTEVAQAYTRANEAFLREQKANPKDRIEVVIGDDKDPTKFQPQAKIIRWGEVNASFRYVDPEPGEPEIRTEGKIIKYVKPKVEFHAYDLDPGDGLEDGGLEIELLLKEKPDTNKFDFTTQTKGLDFFFQPALTQEEIDEGGSRPDDVVGSYAVYHSTKGGMNRADGMEYKVGKAFHIYRPFAHDANGDGVWCDLNVDTEQGILEVTILQSFLDSAVYPVVVDPTFGYTSLGASNTSTGIASATNDASSHLGKSGPSYDLPEAGNVTQISVGLRHTAASESLDVFVAAYAEDSAGADSHDLKASGEQLDVSVSTTAAWADISASGSLIADDYILAAVGNGEDLASGSVSGRFDTESGQLTYSESTTGAGSYATRKAEDPWTETDAASSQKMSIYATYTAAAGAVVEPTGRMTTNTLFWGP